MKNKLLLIAVVCAAIASGCEKNDAKTDKLDQFKQTIENQRRQHDGRRHLAEFAKAARRRRDRRHRLQYLLEQKKHQQQIKLDSL